MIDTVSLASPSLSLRVMCFVSLPLRPSVSPSVRPSYQVFPSEGLAILKRTANRSTTRPDNTKMMPMR